jgi:uncharacterized membrane protein
MPTATVSALLAAANSSAATASSKGPLSGLVHELAPLLPTLHIVHTASSALMLGVVLVAQAVMYPGFAFKDSTRFREAMQHHQRSIGFIVAPGMLIEGASASLLLVLALSMPQAATIAAPLALANAVLLASCWVLTFAIIVPMHMRLTTNEQAPAERAALITRLVRIHWFRTAAWSVHALLACVMAPLALRSAA